MTTAIELLGISGSLRQASHNTTLLRACQELAPDDVKIRIEPLHDIPLYDRDVEAAGYPETVAALRDDIAEADGLLLATPEYNASISGVLKNAIDWASRGKDSPLDDKPVALLSAAGGSGGRGARSHLRHALAHNQVDVIEPDVGIARAWDHIEDGDLISEEHREEIRSLIAALCDRIRVRRDDA